MPETDYLGPDERRDPLHSACTEHRWLPRGTVVSIDGELGALAVRVMLEHAPGDPTQGFVARLIPSGTTTHHRLVVLDEPQGGPDPTERENLVQLGQLLRVRRDTLGLTRQTVADQAGVSPMYLYMIERAYEQKGRPPHTPTKPVLHQLAQILGLDESETAQAFLLAGYAPPTGTNRTTLKRSTP